ncbi:MAG: phosphatidylserine decarboxylase [Gammaproteobacteria bacterium]
MPSPKRAPIAYEGRLVVAIALVVALVVAGLFGTASTWVTVPLIGLVIWFYRDPHRYSPALPLVLVAPCDGIVSDAGTGFDPWLGRPAAWLTVRMGVFDVHGLYGPVEGKIIEQWSVPRHRTETGLLHCLGYHVRTDEGDDVVLEIARNRIAAALSFDYQPGERIGLGRRIGLAPLGCRITLYCAAASTPDVAVGVRVKGGSTVVMNLVHAGPIAAIAVPDAAV